MKKGHKIITFQLNDLSKYRSHLMGVATIMIILCHAVSTKVLMPFMLSRVLIYGNLGVDIFMFLSGLGCFYSLSKTNGRGYFSFYKRRLYRIIPTYLIIFIPINIVYLLIGEREVEKALLSITALEYWAFHKGAWFISIIIPLYFISPFLYKAIRSKWKWCWVIVLIVTIMLLCALPLKDNSSTNLLYNIQFAVNRIPSFILGMAITNDCKESKEINVLWIMLLCILFIPLRYFLPNVFWGWLVVPLILAVFVIMIKWLERSSCIDKSMIFMGTISLESYLLNISINALLIVLILHYGLSESPLLYGNYLQYAIVIIAGTLLAFVVNKCCRKISLK